MIFNAHTIAKGWRSVAIASGSDKHQPALDHAVFIEQYSHGVRLVATDSTVLLHTWCPTAAAEEEGLIAPPDWDEVPLVTAVALDPHGRAKSFLAHAQQLAGDDNAGMIEVSLDLGVIVEEREPRLAGLDPTWCVLEMRKRERLQLRLFEGEWPKWRALYLGVVPQATSLVALNLEVAERLAKLAKIHGTTRLGYHFAGPLAMAKVELIESIPEIHGLVMPCRWDLANNQPAAHSSGDPGSHQFTPSEAPLDGWCEVCGQVEVDHVPGSVDDEDLA